MPSNYGSLLHYSNTKHLRIDNLEAGVVLYSHDLVHTDTFNQNASSAYPYGFSCEVLIHSSVPNAKIMIRVEHFYVPSNSEDCVENYLYVFDSNTSKSKAMTEAGGERGLCRANFPHRPIFTTNPYACIAFHTSSHPPPVTSTQSPGFSLILTAILDTDTLTCPSGNFYCDSRPIQSYSAQSVKTASPLYTDQRSRLSSSSLSGPVITNRDASSRIGYCISEKALCDGIVNCADGRDEYLNGCEAKEGSKGPNWLIDGDTFPNGWLSGFLSLGIPASIAVAVSAIVTFTVCIGAVICCCNRCCKSSSRTGPYSRAFGPFVSCPHYDASVRVSTTGTATSPFGHGNMSVLPNGRHAFAFSSCPQSAYSQHYYSSGATARNFADQKVLFGIPNDHSSMVHTHPHDLVTPSSGLCHSIGQPRLVTSSEQLSSNLRGAVGGAAPQTMNFSHVQAYSTYPASCVSCSVPVHGTPSSPATYLQDQSSTEPCCYTPPPYGACAVPPASSVTASSSRTGTSIGITGQVTRGCSSGTRAAGTAGYVAFAGVNVGGSTDGGSGADLRAAGSIGMLYGPQLSGGGNSALHTNTPVETISQSGGDLTSNGGIVYLGELISPYTDDPGERFRPSSCTSGVIGAGSTTTGSGSSRGRLRHSQRLHLNNSSVHFSFSQPVIDSLKSQVNPHTRRRATTPCHRQHRYRCHHSSDFARAGSSGSHTPASSQKSGTNKTNTHTAPDNNLQPLNNSAVAPIQL